MPVMITLNQIKAAYPCGEGWSAILKLRGPNADHDEPFPLVEALQSNPTSHVVWAFRCLPNGKELAVQYALGCAEMVRHLMTDARSTAALDAVAVYLADGTPVAAAGHATHDVTAAAYAAIAAAHTTVAAAYATHDVAASTYVVNAAATYAANAAAAAASAATYATYAANAAGTYAANAASARASRAARAAITSKQTALLTSILS